MPQVVGRPEAHSSVARLNALASARPVARAWLISMDDRREDPALCAAFALYARSHVENYILPDCRQCGKLTGAWIDCCGAPACNDCCFFFKEVCPACR